MKQKNEEELLKWTARGEEEKDNLKDKKASEKTSAESLTSARQAQLKNDGERAAENEKSAKVQAASAAKQENTAQRENSAKVQATSADEQENTAQMENSAKVQENSEATQESSEGREAENSVQQEILSYVMEKLPSEVKQLIKGGKTFEQALALWENQNLKRENQRLKSRLAQTEKSTDDPLGRGGERARDPFAEGFMQALAQR